MKKRNIDLLRDERKKNEALRTNVEALRTNVKVLVRECELLKSRLDASPKNGATGDRASLTLLKQREMNMNRAKNVLDAMAIFLATKYGENGELRIPRPDMDLLKSNILTTTADRDFITVKVMQRENPND